MTLGRNPARVVAVLGGLGLIVLSLVLWLFVLGPRLATADEIVKQADDTSLGNIALRNRYNQTLERVRHAPQAAADAQALFASMPQEADLPTVLRQLTDAAADAGLDPSNIQVISTSVPAPVGAEAQSATVQLASMDVGITIVGPRRRLLDFIDNLQALQRALLISRVQITGSSDPTAVDQETLQVNGSMFVLQSSLPDLVAQVEALIAEAETEPDTAPAS